MFNLKKRKSGQYYIDIHFNGIRTRRNIGLIETNDKELNKEIRRKAEMIRNQIQTEYLSGVYDLVPEYKAKKCVIDFINETIDLSNRHKGLILNLKEFAGDFIPFQKINLNFLNQFKKHLQDKNLNTNYIRLLFIVLKAALNKARKQKYIKSNPFEDFEMPKGQEVIKNYLTWNEVSKLIETKCSNEEIKRAFLFSCFSGLRYSDIKQLKYSDIQDGSIRITIQKTKKLLIIPVTNDMKKLLYPPDNIRNIEFVFEMPFAVSYVNLIIKQWSKRAGIKKNISFHCGRHTFAVKMINSGVDLYTLSKLLGHSNVSTTEKSYAKLMPDQLIKAMSSLPELLSNYK